jgi:hypothetical protein
MIWTYSNGYQGRPVKMSQALSRAAFLCCPGPSLAGVEERKLFRPGIFVAAINSAYPKLLRPDIWIGGDTPECYHPNLMSESFPKFFQGGVSETKFGDLYALRYAFNTHFIDANQNTFMSDPKSETISFPRATFLFALEFLIKTGFRKIYLVGCDFGGVRDYWHDGHLTKELAEANRRVHEYCVSEVHKKIDVIEQYTKLYSCSTPSPINCDRIPFVPIYQAIDREAVNYAAPDFEFKHILEIKGNRTASGNYPQVPFAAPNQFEGVKPWSVKAP